MITVTEKDSILDHYNLDTLQVKNDPQYLKRKLKEFKKQYNPIIWKNPLNPSQNNLVYYGESNLLKQIRYFPIIQLLVVALHQTQIVVAPNPFTNAVAVTNLKLAETVCLIDMSGRVLQQRSVKNLTGITLQTDGLAPGMYHIKIVMADGSIQVVKLVKQR
jgi:hypothetical protein